MLTPYKQAAALLLILLASTAAAVCAVPVLSADDASLDSPLDALLDAAVAGSQPVTKAAPAGASLGMWREALMLADAQPAGDGATAQGPLPAPVPAGAGIPESGLSWEVEVEHRSIERGPWWRSAASRGEEGEQAAAAIAAAERAAGSMARQLARDVAAVQAAAALPPLEPRPDAPAHGWNLGGVQVGLAFDHNEASVGFSSSSDDSQRGAFEVRATWATTRRLVRLGGGEQEVSATEVSLSISGLALACLATCLLVLLALRRSLPACHEDEEEEEEEGCEEEGGCGVGNHDGKRAAFLQAGGYSPLASSPSE